jgi:hypothetical protein
MNIPIVIDKFFAYATKNNIEIYNEIALQFELACYFRKSLGKEYKVQLERNITFLGMARGDFVKKEIDIVIFSDVRVLKDIFVVELKAILNQKRARPISVFNWIKDLKFLEQLKSAGVGNCYSLFLTDNDQLVSDNTISRSNAILPLLPDFRNRKIQGEYSTHCTPNPNSKSVTLGSRYTFEWKDFVCGQKYFLVEV